MREEAGMVRYAEKKWEEELDCSVVQSLNENKLRKLEGLEEEGKQETQEKNEELKMKCRRGRKTKWGKEKLSCVFPIPLCLYLFIKVNDLL